AKPAFEKLFEPAGIPSTRIGFVLPSENIRSADMPVGLNSESELVSVAIFAEEQQMVEGHVQFAKVRVLPEFPIVPPDLGQRPHDTGAEVRRYAVRLEEKLS